MPGQGEPGQGESVPRGELGKFFIAIGLWPKRISTGGFPERSKGSDCKSDGIAFAGSNPAPPTQVPERGGFFRY